YENYDIRCLSATSAHHCKCLVSRRIEKDDPALFIWIIGVSNKDAICTYMLSDAARLAFGDIFRTNCVEQRCLSVVDVTHDGNYRRSRQLDIVGIGSDKLFEFLFDYHFFERNEADLEAE